MLGTKGSRKKERKKEREREWESERVREKGVRERQHREKKQFPKKLCKRGLFYCISFIILIQPTLKTKI